jgi:hypothetical protein
LQVAHPTSGVPIANPAPPQTQNTNNQNSVTGVTGSTGGLGSNFNAPLYIQGIQEEYGKTIGNAPTAQNILNTGQTTAEQSANDASQAAIANAQQQNAGNQAVIHGQIDSTQKGQALSLQELANQIRAMHQGLGAQLGASGAGSSSASIMGDQGIAQEQNTQRANIQQQAGSDVTNLENQSQAQDADTQTLIEGYKKTAADQVATIKNNYSQLMLNLDNALASAQGEEKARLAEFGQHLTDAANTALGNVESELEKNTQGSLTSGMETLKQGSLPTVQNVNPITMPQLSANATVTPGAGNTTSTGAPAGGSIYSLLQQQQQQPFSS